MGIAFRHNQMNEESNLKKLLMTAVLVFLFFGCSSGPSDTDMKNAIQNKMRIEIQQTVNRMNALAQAFGQEVHEFAKSMGMELPSPEDISISIVSSEELREMDNGDYTAKVIFKTKLKGKDEQPKMVARLKMTQVDGKWKALDVQEL